MEKDTLIRLRTNGLDRAPAMVSPPWARLAAVLSQAAPALAARGAGAGAEVARRLAARTSAPCGREGQGRGPGGQGRADQERRR